MARRGRSMGSGRQTKRSSTAPARRSGPLKSSGGRAAAVGKGPLRGDNQGTGSNG
jgi:hypothetical protein